ncbi:hypothetical protein E1301_Tti008791 [Triplophysa tibetana]|uniref:Uncharacterized protein n=1 Tax=Triplophysa tibetana TaxID=1572043 RepID=A0A5A9NZQ4_9TELE|nr:hypothetical protein E1301_Tti008791 [Triplophysa tibetana]
MNNGSVDPTPPASSSPIPDNQITKEEESKSKLKSTEEEKGEESMKKAHEREISSFMNIPFLPYPPATSALTLVRMGERSPSMSAVHSSEYPQSFHSAIIAPVTPSKHWRMKSLALQSPSNCRQGQPLPGFPDGKR